MRRRTASGPSTRSPPHSGWRVLCPRRLFEIRLSPGAHNTGFVQPDYPRVGISHIGTLMIGDGDYKGLRLANIDYNSDAKEGVSSHNCDGLRIRSTEIVAVYGASGVNSVALLEGPQEVHGYHGGGGTGSR